MIENEIFERINFTETEFHCGEYEECRFIGCHFRELALTDTVFRDCDFVDCDFSLATLRNVVLNDVRFKGCKLLGVHFDDCNPLFFSVSFEGCVLKMAGFYKMKLKKTRFRNCDMQEADLSEADLSEALLENCNLLHAMFGYTNLEKADLRTAYAFSIDPTTNRLRKARFAKESLTGLLDTFGIIID